MLGIAGFMDFVRDKKVARARRGIAVDWDPEMKFKDDLLIRASSYVCHSLFDVEPCTGFGTPEIESQKAVSPCGNWVYLERVLPEGVSLETRSGRRSGVVIFDGDVKIPMIKERGRLWMSHTPQEVFTLRPGTRMARGHTIVAGLGLGYQLQEVCRKKSVKRVTLIEVDQKLVDWVLPRLDLSGKPVEVIVGDARELLPSMSADVALVDIFPYYGGNTIEKPGSPGSYDPQVDFPNIKKTWIWGSVQINSGRRW